MYPHASKKSPSRSFLFLLIESFICNNNKLFFDMSLYNKYTKKNVLAF
jgi:hypothetical protein